MNIDSILESQRKFFNSGATLPIKFRIENLKNYIMQLKNMKKKFV